MHAFVSMTFQGEGETAFAVYCLDRVMNHLRYFELLLILETYAF